MPGDLDDGYEDDYGMPSRRNRAPEPGLHNLSRRIRQFWPLIATAVALVLYWTWPASTAVDWSRYAYVQYATDEANLCNALMVFDKLKTLGSKADRVLLHNPQWASEAQGGSDRNSHLLTVMRKKYGVVLKPVQLLDIRGKTSPAPMDGQPSSWDTSITKLRCFELTEYKRVLHLDSDITLFQHLDELFLLPQAPIAMPRAYWTDGVTGQWPLTSLMMLVEPNKAELEGMLATLREWRENSANVSVKYDMDLLNDRYGASALVLPHRPYALLTAEFRRKDHSAYLGMIGGPSSSTSEWNADEVLKEAKLVHFSDWCVIRNLGYVSSLC